jgi:signal transduction histidine kinase
MRAFAPANDPTLRQGPAALADCIRRAKRCLGASVSELTQLAADLQSLANAASSARHRGWWACVQSRLLVKQGDFETALHLAEQGRQCSMQCPADEDLGLFSLRAYANAVASLGRWADYVATLTQVLAAIRQRDDRLSEVEIFNTIGHCFIVVGLHDLAVQILQQGAHLLDSARQHTRADAHRVRLAHANNASNLASAWLEVRKAAKASDDAAAEYATARALECAEQAYALARKAQNAHLCAGAKDTLAELHLLAGRLPQARRAVVAAQRHAVRAGPGPKALVDAMAAAIDLAAGQPKRALQRLTANADGAIARRPGNDLELRHLRTLVAAREACAQWKEAFRDQAALLAAERRIRHEQLGDSVKILLHQLNSERCEAERLLSHDLRTPLATVLTRLEALRPSSDAATAAALVHVQTSVRTALAVNDAFLAKVRSALLDEREFKPIDLAVLVDDACEEMRTAASASRLAFIARVEDGALRSGALSMGSREYLHRALVNLLHNAVRRAPPGSQVTVGLSRRNEWWCITVADDGPGFASNPITTIVPGLGLAAQVPPVMETESQWLGLRLVYQVVERHRGTMRLGDPGHRGALVEIHLPALPEAA